MSYTFIETQVEEGSGVGVITLNRPDQRNALSVELMDELAQAVDAFENDDDIGCIVLTGKGEKAFAGGADVKQMADKTYAQAFKENFVTSNWERIAQCRKPTIAAVNGYALGGGCELAMMCDIIIAGKSAKFGQPEINLALIPGAGGTQRLTRLLGKSKAMDMCLTGRLMGAEEALAGGLVARVVDTGEVMSTSMEMAKLIAGKSRLAAMATKEAILNAYETTLSQGLAFERKSFHSMFAFEDAREGMEAFIESRPPRWHNK